MLEEIEMMIRVDEETVRELMEIKKEIKLHDLNCKIVKTAGVVAKGLGVALTIGGMIAAPFTFGVSLGLTIGGISTCFAGGVTSIGTGITKEILMNQLGDRTKKLMEKRTNRQLKSYSEVTRIISGMTEKKTEKGDLTSFDDLATEIIEHNNEIFYAYYIYSTVLRFIDIHHLARSSVAPLAVGVISVGGILLQTATTVFMVALVALDIVLLVKDWNNEEALAGNIQELIDVILMDIHFLSTKYGIKEDTSTTDKKHN